MYVLCICYAFIMYLLCIKCACIMYLLCVYYVFIMYLLYLQWLGTNVIEVYKETEKSLTQGKNNTPIYRLIDQISKFIRT